jgi:hypothetical protein
VPEPVAVRKPRAKSRAPNSWVTMGCLLSGSSPKIRAVNEGATHESAPTAMRAHPKAWMRDGI